jgi:GH18 family chitinase
MHRSIAILVACISITNTALSLDIVGYLPYYRMNATYNQNTLPTQLTMLDEIRYFGLTAASNGTIVPLAGSGTLQTHINNIATIKQKIDAMPAAHRPHLDITFGGAGEASSYATIAASSSLSATFAQNIKSLLDQTGATAVDIDWEHPVGTTQFNQYGTMLQRIKQEVGTTNRVYATIDPTIRIPLSVFDGPNGIDGASLMTYELAWWANDPSDPNRGEHSLAQYVTDSVDAWTDAVGSFNRRPYVFAVWGRDAQEADLGIGLPFFGRVIGTSQSPQAGTAYTFAELASGGTADSSGNYYTYFGQNVWTAGPGLAAQRVQFARERALQHIIIWEIGQDLSPTNANSLLRTTFRKNQTLSADFDFDRDVDSSDLDVLRATFGSTSDLRADGNGNGIIDAGDYLIWRKQAGGPGSGAEFNMTVPEPANALCGMLLLLLSFCRQRRKPGKAVIVSKLSTNYKSFWNLRPSS